MVEIAAHNIKYTLRLAAPIKLLSSICGCKDCPLATLADSILKNNSGCVDKAYNTLKDRKCDGGSCMEACKKTAELLVAKHGEIESKAADLAKFAEGLTDATLKNTMTILSKKAVAHVKTIKAIKLPAKSYQFHTGATKRMYAGYTDQTNIHTPETDDPKKETIRIEDSVGAKFDIKVVSKGIDISDVQNISLVSSEKLIGSLEAYECCDSTIKLMEKCSSITMDKTFNTHLEITQSDLQNLKISYCASGANTVNLNGEKFNLCALLCAKPDSKFETIQSVPDAEYNLFKACC